VRTTWVAATSRSPRPADPASSSIRAAAAGHRLDRAGLRDPHAIGLLAPRLAARSPLPGLPLFKGRERVTCLRRHRAFPFELVDVSAEKAQLRAPAGDCRLCYYIASKIRAELAFLALPAEFLRLRGKSITVNIGKPISPDMLDAAIKRVAIMFNPDTAPVGGSYYLLPFEAAARSLKVEPIIATVTPLRAAALKYWANAWTRTEQTRLCRRTERDDRVPVVGCSRRSTARSRGRPRPPPGSRYCRGRRRPANAVSSSYHHNDSDCQCRGPTIRHRFQSPRRQLQVYTTF
jgi:hypothetical protein